VAEQQMSDDRRRMLLVAEPGVMAALIASPDPHTELGASTRATIVAIEDVPGQPDFAFRIVPIGEDVYKQCEISNTPPKRNNLTGGTYRDPADLNESDYRADLIIRATHPEDVKVLWQNKDLLSSKGCNRSIDLVNTLLPAGYKLSVVAQIDRISGTGRRVGPPINFDGPHDCPICGKEHEPESLQPLTDTLRE
jgi:hypothetical protein